jgi:hypothetical protein
VDKIPKAAEELSRLGTFAPRMSANLLAEADVQPASTSEAASDRTKSPQSVLCSQPSQPFGSVQAPAGGVGSEVAIQESESEDTPMSEAGELPINVQEEAKGNCEQQAKPAAQAARGGVRADAVDADARIAGVPVETIDLDAPQLPCMFCFEEVHSYLRCLSCVRVLCIACIHSTGPDGGALELKDCPDCDSTLC